MLLFTDYILYFEKYMCSMKKESFYYITLIVTYVIYLHVFILYIHTHTHIHIHIYIFYYS